MKVWTADSFNVLYFPAGTYKINDSLINPGNGYDGLAIIGEDPATTSIVWGGPTSNSSAMLTLTGWYLRVSRLTFDGNNNIYKGIYKTGGFSTHNEFSDIVFKNFSSGIGLDFSSTTNGQAENAIIRCTFMNCSSGIASCNWNSLDQWVWDCLFQDCNLAINQCIGYFQIYNNVFLRSKTYDIGSSPYKNSIVNNISINSKCFFAGTGAYIRGNKIYSNVDSFTTGAGSSTVMLDNIIRTTRDSMAVMRAGATDMIVGNTFSALAYKWKKWPLQPPFNSSDHGYGGAFNVNKQIEKAIDGNAATSFATQAAAAGIKWNCPMDTRRRVTKYSVAAPASGGGTSPVNFELLGSNNWGYTWDVLDLQRSQVFTGGGNPIQYSIPNNTAYSMYELASINSWIGATGGGRAIVNTGAQAGTYCEQMTLSANPRNLYQDVVIHPDTTYTVSAWMKSNAVTTSGHVVVLWYNTPYPAAFVGGYPVGYIKSDTVGLITGTNGWTHYTTTITAPNNALSAIIYLGSVSNGTSAGTVWFDACSINSTGNASNLLLNPGFETPASQQWFEVSELTLLDSANNDLTKDLNGLVSGADESWGQFYPIDNKVVDTSAITVPTTIPLSGTPLNHHRKIFEVIRGTGNDANAIQSKIDSAAMEAIGTKPVVHLRYGKYTVNRTITVPAGSDMQIVGDGEGTGATTRIDWGGNQIGPLLLCHGPSRVTIKDLILNVPYLSYVGPEALVIENADQVGGRIFGNQFNAGGPQWTQPCDIGLLADRVENSDITMICFYPGFGSSAMVQAEGGPVLAAGGSTNGQISLLGGATGDCQNLFNVTNGGRLDAEGMWNEGDFSRTSGLVNLSNTSGSLSMVCMSWHLLTQTPYPMVKTDNFTGNLTLLLNSFAQGPQSYMPMTGNGSNLNVLSGYNDWGSNNTIGGTTDSTWQDLTSASANANFIGNTSTTFRALDVVVDKIHNVLPDTSAILNSLAQLRAVRTDPPMDRTPGVTDVKLFRVAAWGTMGKVAAHFISADTTATGIKTMQADADNFVSLYPSLVQQTYTVGYVLSQAGLATFTVYDILGNKVSEKSTEVPAGNSQTLFSIGSLSAGSYFMEFHSGQVKETKRFIVVH